MRLTGMRNLDGHEYYPNLEYSSQSKAKKAAEEFRKAGYRARVIDTPPFWTVYSTRNKTK